jgi:hypothetical protein
MSLHPNEYVIEIINPITNELALEIDVVDEPIIDTIVVMDSSSPTIGTITHGDDGTLSRPMGYPVVFWFGTVEPLNALVNDLWIG